MNFLRNLLLALSSTLLFSGCAPALRKRDKTYTATGSTEVNGAMVTSAVKPMGGKQGVSLSAMVYSAGLGETDGPFLWRIEAVGQEGVHQSLTVHRLKVLTADSKRSEPYPAKWLGIIAPFEPMVGKKNEGKVFAKYQLPGKLEVFPEQDGEVTMQAEVSITSISGTRRQKVEFTMEPSSKRKTETIFIPTELAKALRGKDPTEWEWSSNGVVDDPGFWGDDY